MPTGCGRGVGRHYILYPRDPIGTGYNGRVVIAPPDETKPEEIGLRLIGEVSVLNVTPQDVIIIRFEGPVKSEEVDSIIRMWQELTELPNRVVVLAGGADVKKVTPR